MVLGLVNDYMREFNDPHAERLVWICDMMSKLDAHTVLFYSL